MLGSRPTARPQGQVTCSPGVHMMRPHHSRVGGGVSQPGPWLSPAPEGELQGVWPGGHPGAPNSHRDMHPPVSTWGRPLLSPALTGASGPPQGGHPRAVLGAGLTTLPAALGAHGGWTRHAARLCVWASRKVFPTTNVSFKTTCVGGVCAEPGPHGTRSL